MTRHSKRLAGLAALAWLAAAAPGLTAGPDPLPPPPAPASKAQAAPAPAASVPPASFQDGYRLFSQKKYLAASTELRRFVAQRSPDDDDYDWALFFLGISLYELDLSHAAADTLAYLVARKPNVRIVAYSLELLEHITRSRPFDWETVVLNVLVDQDFGFIEGELQDFVHYYQGLFNWEHGYVEWGDRHFEQIGRRSYYFHKYRYQKALYELAAERPAPAAELLEELLADRAVPAELKDEVRVTLARVRYELGNYEGADATYRSVEKPNTEQARYLLERAWGQYRSGNPEKAMGLLYAFTAPSFWRHFTPEYFILKSLIYKDVCQYRNALGVVGEFKGRYGEALAGIYARRDPLESDQLLQVLLEKPAIRRPYDFLRLLETERAAALALPAPELAAHLGELYSLKREAVSRELREAVTREHERLAGELLKYEEEAHLLEYEIGLDMYQRASDFHYREPAGQAGGPRARVAVYPFQGEYWNDELDDYQVVLENKCENLQEWDIFFQ